MKFLQNHQKHIEIGDYNHQKHIEIGDFCTDSNKKALDFVSSFFIVKVFLW